MDLPKIDCITISMELNYIVIHSTYSYIVKNIYAYRTRNEIIIDDINNISEYKTIQDDEPWDIMSTIAYGDLDGWIHKKFKKYIIDDKPIMLCFKIRTNRLDVSDIMNNTIKKFNNIIQLILSIHNAVTTKVVIYELPETLQSFILEDTFKKETVYPELPTSIKSLILSSNCVNNNIYNTKHIYPKNTSFDEKFYCYQGKYLSDIIWLLKFPKYKPAIKKILEIYTHRDISQFILKYFDM